MYSDEVKRKEIINQLNVIGASVNEENGSYVTLDPSGNRIILKV